jgi:hypothetical protein
MQVVEQYESDLSDAKELVEELEFDIRSHPSHVSS